MKKYMEILNVDETMSKEQVSKVYKRLALKNHPDKGGSVDKFKTICEAHEILLANFDAMEDKKYTKVTLHSLAHACMNTGTIILHGMNTDTTI